MDRVTAIKIKWDDGTYSAEIPISVAANNVQWDQNYNLIDILGNVNISQDGNIQYQINKKIDSTQLSNYVANQLNLDVTNWLDENVDPSTVPVIDTSLSIEGAAADAKVVGDELTSLEADLGDITQKIYSKNRFNIEAIEPGYVNQVTGAWVPGSGSYSGTAEIIEVTSVPFVVIAYRYAGTINLSFRYAVYDSNKQYITGAIVSSSEFTIVQHPTDSAQQAGYLVFDNPNIKYIRFSMTKGYFATVGIQITDGNTIAPYTPYTGDIIQAEDIPIIGSSVIGKRGSTVHVRYIPNNATINVGVANSIKKNKVYHLHTIINTSFNAVLFGHGEERYSLYFKIDSTNITFMTNSTESTALPHGLTLDTYIDFMLIVGDRNTGTIILNTLGGVYTKTVQVVNGYKGDIFVRPVNCRIEETFITFSSADFRQPFWLFGDSYFTHTSTSRWTYWLLEWGFGRCLLNGFPGANSDEALPQVRKYIGTWGIPKYIVWCLGMNDPDDGAINASWLECVTELIKICNINKLELILATIPNVPSLDHTYKNTWIRESGYRYIDFAKAVGAEAVGSSWYTGALSSDNTHPSEIGARLLCQQALIDVPELTLGNI